MSALAFPSALRGVLDAVAREEGLATSDEVGVLARGVHALSEAYNAANFPVEGPGGRGNRGGGGGPPSWTREMASARLQFFLPRDALKVAAALRDVPLRPDARVLDLGAGMGASALGVRLAQRGRGGALHPSAAPEHVGPADAVKEAATPRGELVLVEPQGRALGVARALHAALAASPEGGPDVVSVQASLDAVRSPLGPLGDARFDLVLLSQVLVEVDTVVAGRTTPGPDGKRPPRTEEERVERLAERLRRLALRRLAPGGRLVVIEPALKVTARRLQAIRDLLREDPDVAVVAPCTHAGPCPLLLRESDWCHDDLPADLPAWLVPVAREAGLRWQGLTFARLVLARRADLAVSPEPTAPRWRVVAPPAPSRGKHALRVCGPGAEDAPVLERLDRAASEANAPWSEVARGEALGFPAEVLTRGDRRIAAEDVVTREP